MSALPDLRPYDEAELVQATRKVLEEVEIYPPIIQAAALTYALSLTLDTKADTNPRTPEMQELARGVRAALSPLLLCCRRGLSQER